jgi:6-phosphogluconolactonase
MMPHMSDIEVEILPDPEALAARAADLVAGRLAGAVADRAVATLAVSGGGTPLPFFAELAERKLPWDAVHVFQVDERVAPAGHPDRNLITLREELAERVALPEANLHAMPVEADDLDAAARAYADELAAVCGHPPVLDLVHLGLGDDGHTASWPPGDPIAAIVDAEVAICPVYRGRRRMTLTVPAVNRARAVLWLVSGPGKADMLARVLAGDPALPASLVRPDQALVLADRAAAQRVASTN